MDFNLPGHRFDRAHFKAFGDSSLTFEVVYYALGSYYDRYIDAQQAINLALVVAFEERGIDFVFPTRTLHVEAMQPDFCIAQPAEFSMP